MSAKNVHIRSTNFTTGSNYDGTWDTGASLRGEYQLVHSHMDDGAVPIIWSSVSDLRISYDQGAGLVEATWAWDFASLGTETDLAVWVANLQISLDAIIGVNVVTISEVDDDFFFDFHNTAATTDNFNLLLADPLTTISGLFDLSVDILMLPGNTTTLSGRHVNTRPSIMDIVIDEAADQISTTDGDTVTYFIGVSDSTIAGTYATFYNDNVLTISIFRYNFRDVVCPVELEWHLILTRSN